MKLCEKLDHLPTYGPMYVPVTEDGKDFFSEGYVVRFFKKDGTDWVANFEPGWTDLYKVYSCEDLNRVVVIAGGLVYIMSPENIRPVETFSLTMREVIESEKYGLIGSDDTDIYIFDGNGLKWRSPRISWDGIKNMKISGSTLSGLTYNPMEDSSSYDEWIDFSIDLETHEVSGGSYRLHFYDDGSSRRKKRWWVFWR